MSNLQENQGVAQVALGWDVLTAVLQRPVAFYPIFARIGGSAKAGLFLSQAYYWHDKGSSGDGWFYKTQAEWRTETYLSDEEQLTARRELKKRGLLEEEKRGIPAKLFFRLNKDAIMAAISAEITSLRAVSLGGNKVPGKPETVFRDAPEPASRKAGNKLPPNAETLTGTENTTENTQKTQQQRDQSPAVVSDVISSPVEPNPDLETWRQMLISARLSASDATKFAGPDVPRILAWWATVDKTTLRGIGLLISALRDPSRVPEPVTSNAPAIAPEEATIRQEIAARREAWGQRAFAMLPDAEKMAWESAVGTFGGYFAFMLNRHPDVLEQVSE